MPDFSKDSGLSNLAKASVVGEPWFGPVLSELDLTDEEIAKLEYLLDFYSPDPGPIIAMLDEE